MRAQMLLTCTDASLVLRRFSRAQTLLTCSTSVYTHYTDAQLALLTCSRSAACVLRCCSRDQQASTPIIHRCSTRAAWRGCSLLQCSRCVGAQQLPPQCSSFTSGARMLNRRCSVCSRVQYTSSAQRVLIEISRDLNGAQMLHKRPHRSNRCSPSPLDHLAAALVLRECCSTVTAIQNHLVPLDILYLILILGRRAVCVKNSSSYDEITRHPMMRYQNHL